MEYNAKRCGPSVQKQLRKEALKLQVPLVEADSLAGVVSSLFGRAVKSVFKLVEDSPQ
jgi:hypothetical protein